MKVFVTGATGVLGTSAVRALLADGHEVTGLTRGTDKGREIAALGAETTSLHLFDVEGLADTLQGFDAVCNLVTHIPIGMAGMRPGAWRVNDRLRTEGSRAVVQAALEAGVRRLVQESISLLYADGGEAVLTETSPLTVTRTLEPAAVAETNALGFASASREAVVLRFGNLVGSDATSQWLVDRAKSGRPIGVGDVDNWAHILHPDDAGSAIAAALHAPTGVYNVGADPLRRGDLVSVFAAAANRSSAAFLPRIVVKMAGERMEPLTRSQRVSSARLHEMTGWKPAHPVFESDWLMPA